MAKKYKCRVEYLESSGTQWIDTGIAPSNITPIAKLKFVPTQQYTGGNYGIFGCFGADNTRFQVFYNSVGIGTYVSKSWQANTTYEVELNGKVPSATINGTVETSGYSKDNGFSSYNMYLFTRNNVDVADNGIPLKLHYCKIWNNELLVRDFIPVLDLSGKPAMYDQVSGKLFYNQGTGEFTYGRQIIPVEYLESTETQYIDTGFALTANSTLDFNFSPNEQSGLNLWVCGSYTTDTKLTGFRISSSTVLQGYIDNASSISVSGNNIGKKYHCVMNSTNWSVNGTDGTSATQVASRCNLTIFGWNASPNTSSPSIRGMCSAKMYYFKISDNGVLVRDFIPCIDENHIPFMFDLVTNTCYLNAGTGQFKVGPNVEKVWGSKKLRRKLALMLANLKKKRKYYCEVEYLEGTGTQYIDTGLYGTTQSQVDIVFGMTSAESGAAYNGAIFGGRTGQTSNTFTMFKLASQTPQYFRFDYSGQKQVAYANQITWNNTSKYRFQYDSTKFITTNITTGESNSENLAPPSSITTDTICLFCVNTSGTKGTYFSGRIYKYWYTDGTNTIDLIPVLGWDGKGYMYDKVSGKLFKNAGTGDFVVGRQIHPVEYIESTGTQYIDTGYKPNTNTRTVGRVRFNSFVSSNADYIFGVFESPNNYGLNVGSARQYFNVPWGSNSGIQLNGLVPQLNTDYEFDISKTGYLIDSQSYGEISGASVNSTRNMYLFWSNGTSASGMNGRIYYCKIYDNGVLVHDYIPAIDETGKAFMFDRVSHTIYDNAGTGAFAYPPVELEYLESSGTQYIDLGFKVDDTYGYKVNYEYLNANDRVVLGTKGSGDTRWCLSGSHNTNVNLSWNTSIGFAGLGLNKRQVAQMNYLNDRKRFLNDVELTPITETLASGAGTYNVCLFGAFWGSGTASLFSAVRLYSTQISKGTEVFRDFIPVYYNGSAGMWDKVNSVFYSNAGTNAFVVGAVKEPEYE